MVTTEVLLPHNREMEMALLGSFLLDPPLMDVLTDLEPSDFYLHAHSTVFSMMRAVWDRGEPLDYVSLLDEIEARKMDQVVSPGYILDLQNATPASVYASHYAVKVKRYAELRKYIVMAGELARQAYNGSDPDVLFAWLHEQLSEINLGRVTDEALMTWEESFDKYDEILAERKRQAALPVQEKEDWSWPWTSWNRRVDPLDPGMLMTLGAADGAGKTVYAESISEWWARRGHWVVFVHFELNRILVLDRRGSRTSGYERRILASGKLTQEQEEWLDYGKANMKSWPGGIQYLHTPGWTIEKVIQELRRLHAIGRCDAVVVDYLEKAKSSRTQIQLFGPNKDQREADSVEQLKNFAEEVGIRVVMLTQFKKEAKDASVEELTRTGIRGAGEKTEKANLVVLLHRALAKKGETDRDGKVITEPGGYSRMATVIVNKQTMYATGSFTQYFRGETFQVGDYA